MALSARAGAVYAVGASTPRPAPAAETAEQAAVPRAELWNAIAAARFTVRRLTNGRLDSESIAAALEPLERALVRLPKP
jgi:hypothetical protein